STNRFSSNWPTTRPTYGSPRRTISAFSRKASRVIRSRASRPRSTLRTRTSPERPGRSPVRGAAGSPDPDLVLAGAAGSPEPDLVLAWAAGSPEPDLVLAGAAGSPEPDLVPVFAPGS